ncbi:hypothetical protein ACR77J_13805 [Tissierella praeacuta]
MKIRIVIFYYLFHTAFYLLISSISAFITQHFSKVNSTKMIIH